MRPHIHPLLLGTLMVVLTCALASPAALAEALTPKLAVHFAPKPAGDPDGIDTHLVNFFGKAKKTLHGAFFEIREQKFVDALIAAKKRKVEVKILTDNASFYLRVGEDSLDKTKHNAFVQQLLDAGIEVKDDEDRSALMHNKFCIIDGRYVWSGSVNLTDTFATNCNNGVELESPKMAVVYEREFEKKFAKRLFGKKAPSYAEQQKVTVEGVEMEVLFAPEDDPMSRMLVLLNSAKKSVHFMQFAFTDESVTTILLTKFKAGVKVGGIFDHRLYRSTGPYGDFSTLTRDGVPVQLYNGPGLFHHKVFIIDAGTPHAIVITGSQNASSNGNDNNDENVLIMHDRRISELYMAEYNRLLQESSEVSVVAVYDKDPLAGTSIPEAHVMFSSNGADVKRIKLEYPARWPLDPDARKRISVWRRGRNITASAGLEFYGKGLYVNNPQMTATGQNAVLELRFKKMAVSEIPGFYNLYISVSHGNATDDFRPIRQQPTLKVLPGADAKPSKPRKGARAQVMEALTEDAVAQAQNRDAARTVEGTRSVMDEVKEDVAADLEAGKLDSAMKFVEGLEALVKSGKSAPKLGAKARDVRRALRAVESGSPIEAQAQTLLERLEAATR